MCARVVKKVKQFTIKLVNRPGLLGALTSILWRRGVNIQAFLANVHEGQGEIYLIVDKPLVARKAFAEIDWVVTEQEVIALTLPDKPGSLAAVASKLGDAGIDIKYAYSGPAKVRGIARTYLAVSDLPGALKVLR